ncbi:shikimate kinase [Treponema primitia]|uniref:shikimate kinase n=1 Tax=Treponema primitia TaxID=88058 RepID=UPI0002554DB1|nr:shikimate kinase [Treponema primitia]
MENHSTRIILITGPKHSGKTSAGRVLAELLGASFVDLDELIEQQSGKSPRALYKEDPEVFRQAETRALASLLSENIGGEPRVVAAGGGLIDNPEALELLQQRNHSGAEVMTVYLEITADTAWERITKAAQKTGELPPFLNTENPRETHAALHKRRGAAYREFASLTLSAEGKTSGDIGREITGRLKRKDI